MVEVIGSSAFVAALLFGLRHGFDWDHIAALSDLTGSQQSAPRSMRLATLYAVGHACMVLVLGTAAILFSERLPSSVDTVMERVVGVSLLLLAAWMMWTAITSRAAPPLRSHWMLVIEAARRLAGRRSREGVPIVIEHSHPHDHRATHEHTHRENDHVPDHDATGSVRVVVAHSHTHRHVALAPVDPFVRYSDWSSFGVGLLHGIGAETPTQLLVFAAAASADGRATSIGLLVCFLLGLLASNTAVAAASTLGFRGVLRSPVLGVVLAGATGLLSLVIGTALLLGRGPLLPAIFGG